MAATIENTVIQPLADNDIIKDPALERTILAYIRLVQICTGKTLGELEVGDVYCCAWFAVEQYVVSRPIFTHRT